MDVDIMLLGHEEAAAADAAAHIQHALTWLQTQSADELLHAEVPVIDNLSHRLT